MNRNLIYTLLLSVLASSLSADSVTVKASKQLIENVKTSSPNSAEIIVESSDGTKQTFKKNQITVVNSPVVWEEKKPVEKPGFFSRLFGSNKKEETKETATANVSTQEKTEEPKSFFDRRFPEIAMGTIAVLWILLP
ncbi:LIMLP_04285 family protein [Leptospira sp. 'Mane']|uniref:LIMLP_04285 family protein n=1 Tax=Leptospira sp. 'Mane' TaxID=3387407 RepID=UPI00398A9286